MTGRTHRLLEAIIDKKAQGNPTLISVTKTKLILKGINPNHFGPTTPDDPSTLKRVEKLATRLGIAV